MIKNQSLEHQNICLASCLHLYRCTAKSLSANTLEYLYVFAKQAKIFVLNTINLLLTKPLMQI